MSEQYGTAVLYEHLVTRLTMCQSAHQIQKSIKNPDSLDVVRFLGQSGRLLRNVCPTKETWKRCILTLAPRRAKMYMEMNKPGGCVPLRNLSVTSDMKAALTKQAPAA